MHQTCEAHSTIVQKISELDTSNAVLKDRIADFDKRLFSHQRFNEATFNEIKELLGELKDAMVGTFEKKGLNKIVMEHDDFLRPIIASNQSLINWIYKALMVFGMSALLFLVSTGKRIFF